MRSFDLFLELPSDDEKSQRALWTALCEISAFRSTPDDPSRLIFRDADTSIHFSAVVRRDLLSSVESSEWDDGLANATDVMPDDHEDMNDDDEEDEDEEELTEMPLLAFNVPLLRPTFFVRAVIELIEQLRKTAPLRVLHPQEQDESEIEFAPDQPIDTERLVGTWTELNRGLIEELRDRHHFVGWTPIQSSRFYDFGRARAEIARAIADESVEVPVLQPAAIDGSIGSLVYWDPGSACVIPRCDSVLVPVPVERRGLFRSKTVIEERVVPGDRVWDIASRHGEFRSTPTEHLVYRPANPLPQDLLDALRELPVLGEAKRTELAGVVDVDLLPDVEENEPGDDG